MISEEEAKRFWAKAEKQEDGCWLWTGRLKSNGYATITLNRHVYNAHRLAYELSRGKKIKPGKVVMHTCDVRHCVNPKHLRQGTQSENTQDMYKKGRGRRSKFTEEDKKALVDRYLGLREELRLFFRENRLSRKTLYRFKQEVYGKE